MQQPSLAKCPFMNNSYEATLSLTNTNTTFILGNKEYTYVEAMKILMKGEENTLDNRKFAHSYLMFACRKPCETCRK